MERQDSGPTGQRPRTRSWGPTYTPEELLRIQGALLALPPIDPSTRRATKQGAIRYLAKAIGTLQQRGYTIEEVTESLRGHGLDITTPTLRSYLQRVKSAAETRPKAPRRSPRLSAKTEAAKVEAAVKPTLPMTEAGASMRLSTTAKSDVAAAAAPDTAPLRSGKDAFLIKDKDSY